MNKYLFVLPFLAMIFDFTEPNYCKLSDNIFTPYNKELKIKNDLYLVGSGGAMMGNVQNVNASYVAFKKLDIENARKLYVEIMEGFLMRYNKNEAIRPYLHNYPVTVDNFKVSIRFENVDEDFVALIFNTKDSKILYSTYNAELRKFEDLYEEPYEVARQIVYGQ